MALIEISNIDLINLDLALDLAIKNREALIKTNPECFKNEIKSFNDLKIKLRTDAK